MIVVTGTPRSGTSLMMQTLALLGVPMAAPKFISVHDKIKNLMPMGYYELDIWDGIFDSRFFGMAIKLFGYQFARTPKALITKTIHTTRDESETIESYKKILPLLPKKHRGDAEDIIAANNLFIEKSLTENHLEVSLSDMKNDKEKTLNKIISYLEINPTIQQINHAKNNIQCQQQQHSH